MQPLSGFQVRKRELMGVVRTNASDVSRLPIVPFHSEASYIQFESAGATPTEDIHVSSVIYFLFEANFLGDLSGKLVFEFEICDPIAAPSKNSLLSLSQPELFATAQGALLTIAQPPGGSLRYRWGYSRRAQMRTTCIPDSEDEPGYREQLHATFLQPTASRLPEGELLPPIAIQLSPREIGEIRRIDLSESLLEEIDSRLVGRNGFLEWNAEIVSHHSVELAFTEAATPDAACSLSICDQTYHYGKRIRPIVEYSASLVRDGKLAGCAQIGVAV